MKRALHIAAGAVLTAPCALAQQSPPAELPQIRDIAPPVDVLPWPLWMVILAALAVAAVLGLIVWLLVRWLRNRPPPLPPSPRTIAVQALQQLRHEVERMEPYAFSIAVSDVLRHYIGEAYHLHAEQQTSPEFLAVISTSRRFSDEDRRLLGEFLERCDLIKFARIDASYGDSRELLERAIAFVQGGRE